MTLLYGKQWQFENYAELIETLEITHQEISELLSEAEMEAAVEWHNEHTDGSQQANSFDEISVESLADCLYESGNRAHRQVLANRDEIYYCPWNDYGYTVIKFTEGSPAAFDGEVAIEEVSLSSQSGEA